MTVLRFARAAILFASLVLRAERSATAQERSELDAPLPAEPADAADDTPDDPFEHHAAEERTVPDRHPASTDQSTQGEHDLTPPQALPPATWENDLPRNHGLHLGGTVLFLPAEQANYLLGAGVCVGLEFRLPVVSLEVALDGRVAGEADFETETGALATMALLLKVDITPAHQIYAGYAMSPVASHTGTFDPDAWYHVAIVGAEFRTDRVFSRVSVDTFSQVGEELHGELSVAITWGAFHGF